MSYNKLTIICSNNYIKFGLIPLILFLFFL
jgi:hypothetical protein